MRQAGSSAYNYTTRRRGLSRFLAGSMVLAAECANAQSQSELRNQIVGIELDRI
jgi:hypothetical protein